MTYLKNKLLIAIHLSSILLIAAASAEAQLPASNLDRTHTQRTLALVPRNRFSLQPTAASSSVTGLMPVAAGPNLQVLGSGTIGRLTKWTGFGSSSLIGDSNIFEDKFGKVGIGTSTPTAPLTVQGMIQITLGGLKFPDGSVQTTAAGSGLQMIVHNGTLQGDGTSGSPLGVAVPLNLTGFTADPTVRIINTGPGLFSASTASAGAIIRAGTNPSGAGFNGVEAEGGSGTDNRGGAGVNALGGQSTNEAGGAGIFASGGTSITDVGGDGVTAVGGTGSSGGGNGVSATGQAAFGNPGGDGVFAAGGNGSAGSGGVPGTGGVGLRAQGGTGIGAGALAGDAIVAIRGIGVSGGTNGRAAFFDGDVEITGNLNVTGATKNFKIDHPLDPENRYLFHAAVESSEVLNVYSGNAITDENGEAVIALPEWFDSLNRDLRYQLTSIGTFAQAIVSEKVKRNRFKIRTNLPNIEVSWQVTGVRSDPVMKRHPFRAEQEKPERERGHYLHPELFNQTEGQSVDLARGSDSKKKLDQRETKQPQTQQR